MWYNSDGNLLVFQEAPGRLFLCQEMGSWYPKACCCFSLRLGCIIIGVLGTVQLNTLYIKIAIKQDNQKCF